MQLVRTDDWIVPNKEMVANKKWSMQLVPMVMKWLKSTITKQINNVQDNFIFFWQKSYYDRIIRNENELNRIRKYIIENPLKWEYDELNS
jgi:REP element-mobilizing transposase RayT